MPEPFIERSATPQPDHAEAREILFRQIAAGHRALWIAGKNRTNLAMTR
jgi:hypothetical protein